jgi:hypothetical protein
MLDDALQIGRQLARPSTPLAICSASFTVRRMLTGPKGILMLVTSVPNGSRRFADHQRDEVDTTDVDALRDLIHYARRNNLEISAEILAAILDELTTGETN